MFVKVKSLRKMSYQQIHLFHLFNLKKDNFKLRLPT